MKYTFDLFDKKVTLDCNNPLSPKQAEIKKFVLNLFPNDDIQKKLFHRR